MRSPLVALLVAGSITGSWFTIVASDGQPPVTIIEIPIPPTTVAESSTVPASSETPASTTGVVEHVPPAADMTEPDTSEVDPVLNVGGPDWSWPARVGLALVLWSLAVFSLVLVLRVFGGTGLGRTRSNPSESNPIAAAIAASSRFEAVEYRTGSALIGSAVYGQSIGEFSSLEEAIDAARLARSLYQPQTSYVDAWWVVWNLSSKRASWIAEWDTPGESVIDLRSGRREPYVAQDTLQDLHEDIGPPL